MLRWLTDRLAPRRTLHRAPNRAERRALAALARRNRPYRPGRAR